MSDEKTIAAAELYLSRQPIHAHVCGEPIWTRDQMLRAFCAGQVAVIDHDPSPADEGRSICFVCAESFYEGDPVYYSEDGYMHDYCCGPERSSFYNADEAPLSEGEPIPRPLIWHADELKGMELVDDSVNDRVCVDRFAMSMKAKLSAAREKGRGGWDRPEECSLSDLSSMLIKHVSKGDPIDVANFAMMLHQRGGRIETMAPVAATTTDYLGCQFLGIDIERIEKIAAAGSEGSTEVVYLYAGPTPTPVSHLAAKPLEWEVDGEKFRARSGDREYMLNVTSDGVTWAGCTRVYSGTNLTWSSITDCSFVTLEEAKTAAHADYQRRILSALASVAEHHLKPLAARSMQANPCATTAPPLDHVAASFQGRVQPWMMACFGPEISADKLERNDRFIEEALELVQASGYPKDRAIALVDYVYGRDQGEINQEVGGVMVTLAAHCLAHGVDMHEAAETELSRIWTKVEQIRAKQKAKPTGSALPIATTEERADG